MSLAHRILDQNRNAVLQIGKRLRPAVNDFVAHHSRVGDPFVQDSRKNQAKWAQRLDSAPR